MAAFTQRLESPTRSEPDMTLELGVVPLVRDPHVLYQLQLRGGQRVYMRVSRTSHMNEERIVVIVDAPRFAKLWAPPAPLAFVPVAAGRRLLARRLARSSEQAVPRGPWDGEAKKLANTIRYFELGIYNPVPLAEVACYPDAAGRGRIGFVNGHTRTRYLLEHGAASFPVLCESTETARCLHESAGIAGQRPKTVEELAPLELCSLGFIINNGLFDPQTHEFDRFRLVRSRWGGQPWWQPDLAASRERCPYD